MSNQNTHTHQDNNKLPNTHTHQDNNKLPNAYTHQDWTPVTISKPRAPEKKTTIAYNTPKMRYDDDGQEIITLNSMNDKSFVQMRDALKLTRQQVAQGINVKVGIINDIENGKVADKATIGKYKTYLKNYTRKMIKEEEIEK